MDDGREQQRVEHRLREADAGRRLLEVQEAHVERRVVGDQHGVLAESCRTPAAPRSIVGWPSSIDGFDARDRRWPRATSGAAGSTSCSNTSCSSSRPLTMRTAPIETISSPRRRIEPGGLGVEHRVAQRRRADGRPAPASVRAGGTGRSRRTPAGSRRRAARSTRSPPAASTGIAMRKISRCDGLSIWYQISPSWRSTICAASAGTLRRRAPSASVCQAAVVSMPSGARVQIRSRWASAPAACRRKRSSRMPNSSRSRAARYEMRLHRANSCRR